MVDSDGLTHKQKIFVTEYLDTGNGRQSALKAYDTTDPNTAGAIACENLTKPNVIEYLQSKAQEVASNMYRLALNAESETVQVSAGKDVLDRAGYKPVERADLTTLGEKLPTVINIVRPDDSSELYGGI